MRVSIEMLSALHKAHAEHRNRPNPDYYHTIGIYLKLAHHQTKFCLLGSLCIMLMYYEKLLS